MTEKTDYSLPILMKRAGELLAQRFGHSAFLAGQEQAMRSILSRRNLLVVMPTGSGKSLLYQLPALMQNGLTLVISPLIALMKDQVDELARKGVPATFVNSSLGLDEQRRRLESCAKGEARLLYVAPERFQSAAFLNTIRRVKIARMAVDEAHCISEWGHDFRPDYRRLKGFREQMGSPLVTALTATATPTVQRDIVESLGLAPSEVDVHVHGFDRPNLALKVVRVASSGEKASFLDAFVQARAGSGIIYAGTRKLAEELAESLRRVEPTVAVYHAGMEPDERSRAQEAFLSGRSRVVIATMAFGMGIDKPDVRFVVHVTYPASVEQYYQEIGRAGRDGKPSECVLLHDSADRRLREFFIDLNYPARDVVEGVADALWAIGENPVMMTYREIADLCGEDIKDGHVGAAVRLLDEAGLTRAFAGEPTIGVRLCKLGSEILSLVKGASQRRVVEAMSAVADLESTARFEMELSQIVQASGLGDDQVRRALLALDKEGMIDYDPPFRGRGIEKLAETLPPFERIPIDWARQETRRAEEERKLAQMEDYLRSPGCRRDFILRYFGEETGVECRTCDRCEEGGQAVEGEERSLPYPEIAGPALAAMLHLRFPLGKALLKRLLKGSRDKRILEWRLDRNPCYGALEASRADIDGILNDLMRKGYIDTQSGGEYGSVLVLTQLGQKAAREATVETRKPPEARPQPPKPTKTEPRPPASMEAAVLECLAGLKFPVGVGKVAEVLTGSRAKWITEWQADKLAVYGAVKADRESVKTAVDAMVMAGLLERNDNSSRPVLKVTEAGKKRLSPAPARSPLPPPPAPPPTQPKLEDHFAAALDDLVRELLVAEAEKAKEILPRLAVFHPREILKRLEEAFATASSERVAKRAAWAAGELGGAEMLPFLTLCARSPIGDVRRIAASAIGKVVDRARNEAPALHASLAGARETLKGLAADAMPHVRQYAEKALTSFPARASG